MKRIWIGVVLLALLLFVGLMTARATEKINRPVAESLADAARSALEADWTRAGRCAARAQAQWQSGRNLSTVLADHTPMEQIESLFAELQIFLQTRESVHFAATCANLCQLVRAMEESHSINWQNLL